MKLTTELSTRNGLPAKIYETLPDQLVSVMGAIYEDSQWKPCCWTSEGYYVNSSAKVVHKLDLMIINGEMKCI
jgi:hypothetical protein